VFPLRAVLKVRDYISDMLITRENRRIAGMFVQVALRLIKGDLRQTPAVDRLDEFYTVKPSVLEMLGPRQVARS
jgi:hypothetical protein